MTRRWRSDRISDRFNPHTVSTASRLGYPGPVSERRYAKLHVPDWLGGEGAGPPSHRHCSVNGSGKHDEYDRPTARLVVLLKAALGATA